jgi:hypothetical protein
MTRKENRFCSSDRCRRTTQPHQVQGGTYTCLTCANVKHAVSKAQADWSALAKHAVRAGTAGQG